MRLARSFAPMLCIAIAACASGLPQSPARAIAELAPTGTLRVGFHATDPFLAARDAGSRRYTGVAPDLAGLLAARLDTPMEAISYANAPALLASVGTGEWDIAFVALDPALRVNAGVSRPYLEADFGYLAPAGGGRLRHAYDADQSDVRIAVPSSGIAYRLLTATIRHAQVVPVRGGKIALAEAFSSGSADAYAESLQMLAGIAPAMPEHRVLEGRYAAVQYAVLLPKGSGDALRYVNAFLDAAAASGEIDAAIGRAGLRFVRVPAAPAAAHGIDRATTQGARSERVSGETADRAP